MKAALISLVFLLSACSAKNAISPDELSTKLRQHDVTLQLIVDYIAKLQELGMLPKATEMGKQIPDK